MQSLRSSVHGALEFRTVTSLLRQKGEDEVLYFVMRGRAFCSGRLCSVKEFRRCVTRAAAGDGGKGELPKLDYDSFDDLFGLGVDLRSRKDPSAKQSRLKHEQDGSPLKDIQCPACEGRGYSLCPQCNSRNLEASCPQCSGRGYFDCALCGGKRVSWEDLNDLAWASLYTRSPEQIAEDEAVENMPIPALPKRKTKRIYGPLPPETREKIRRSLKDLEARTGFFSRKLKEVYQDPVLQAERVAAIKRGRGTVDSRKRTSIRVREYFQSPENRLKHSQSMIGVRYTCTACGKEGHRRHYCPTLGHKSKQVLAPRPKHCSLCGEIGHERTSCTRELPPPPNSAQVAPRVYRCGICDKTGHSKRNCPTLKIVRKRCSICGQLGHNKRGCSARPAD